MKIILSQAHKVKQIFINLFVPSAPFLYPLKTSEGRERVHWKQTTALLLVQLGYFSKNLSNKVFNVRCFARFDTIWKT